MDGKKSTRFNVPGDTVSGTPSNHVEYDHGEVTRDVVDSVAVYTANAEDRKLKVSFGSSGVRIASMKNRQVSQEMKRLTSVRERPQKQSSRSKSGAVHALTGLKFISKSDGGFDWKKVEKMFDELTAATNGFLPRALFWECIGTFTCDGILSF